MRRGRFSARGVVVLTALALSAPAFADNGTAVDQGYPCATAPAGQTCTQPTVTTPAASPTTPPTSGVAGAKHSQAATPTSSSTAPAAAPTATPAPVVSHVRGAQHTQTPAAAAPAPASSSGSLPFTGLQLGIFALVALALVAGGFALRSTARQRPTP